MSFGDVTRFGRDARGRVSPHLALGRTVVKTTVEFGGQVFPGLDEVWLVRFAEYQGAVTYLDKMFTDLRATYTTPDTFAPRLIDRVVRMNGRISFTLRDVDVAGALSGEDRSWTAAEVRYLAATPAASAITTFFHGADPF